MSIICKCSFPLLGLDVSASASKPAKLASISVPLSTIAAFVVCFGFGLRQFAVHWDSWAAVLQCVGLCGLVLKVLISLAAVFRGRAEKQL
jgi:hypothetical protein